MGSVRLRVVVRGLSPLIVRTLDVPGSATLDVVHEALLVCFGWSGECLHEFTIRAAGYSSDWMVDACDTRDVTIDSLGLRVGERFTWRYDFLAGWVIDLRVEAVTGDELATIRCVSGRRAGPPEWCGGPAGFQAWEDSHSLLEFLECIGELRDGVDATVHRSIRTTWRTVWWRWRVGSGESGSGRLSSIGGRLSRGLLK